jgi:hypothetical protein
MLDAADCERATEGKTQSKIKKTADTERNEARSNGCDFSHSGKPESRPEVTLSNIGPSLINEQLSGWMPKAVLLLAESSP